MNQIKVVKTVVEGRVFFTVTDIVTGVPVGYCRNFTGHTSADGGEIGDRRSTIGFAYGVHNKNFDFSALLDTDTAAERAQKLIDRIVVVRDWVDSCKAQDIAASGVAVVSIPPSVASLQDEIIKLQDEVKRLVRARDNKGRFAGVKNE